MKNNRALTYLLGIYIASALLISYLPWGADISQGIGMILVLTFAIQVFAKRTGVSFPRELLAFMAFSICSLQGTFVARDPVSYRASEFTLFQLVILVAIACNVLKSRWAINLTVKVFVIASLIAACLSIARPDSLSGGQVASVLVNPNLYGLILLFAIVFCIYLLWGNRNRWLMKLFCFVSIPIFVSQIILTGSRKAILGIMALPVILWLLYAWRRFAFQPIRVMAIMIIVVGILVGVYATLQQSPLYYRMQNLQRILVAWDIEAANEGSIPVRLLLYKSAFLVWQEHPLFGVGGGQFRFYASEYVHGLPPIIYAHSNYMEILANFGLVGFLLYYSIYAIIIRNLLRLRKLQLTKRDALIRQILSTLMILLVVSEVAWVTYYDKMVWIVLSMVIAMTHAIMREYKKGVARAVE